MQWILCIRWCRRSTRATVARGTIRVKVPKVSVLSAADETAGVEERRGIDETPEMVWGSHQDTQDRGLLNGIATVPYSGISTDDLSCGCILEDDLVLEGSGSATKQPSVDHIKTLAYTRPRL